MNAATGNRLRLTVDHLVVEVTLKPIRRMYLRLRSADGPVLISAPRRTSLTAINGFIRAQIPWIERQRVRLRERKQSVVPSDADSESLMLWGRAYPIERIGYRKASVHFTNERISLYAPEPADPAICGRLLDAWYQERLAEALVPLVTQWALHLKLSVPRVRVRKMTSRWGSCSLGSRYISVNLELARRPPNCLEYIVVHELLHFIEQAHNARFYALLDRHLPQWREVRRELNAIPISD